jgi:ABC-type Mn2+/Zn2+ transport system ATPase subunit
MSCTPASTSSGLRIDDLTVRYGTRLALEGACIACHRGEIVGLLGPNGAGKSTLLKAVLGLTGKESGSITLDGAPLDRRHRARIAYTPQTSEVDWSFPITVQEMVVLGRQARRGLFGGPRRADWQIARDALDRLGMGTFWRRQIGELSGGERQRVFLARALAQEGDVLLLDEPLTGVDAQTQSVVLDLMVELRRQGLAILVTTHDLVQAAELCDSLCLLNTRVVASGAPGEVLTPRSLMETYGGGEVLRLIDGTEVVGLPHGGGHHEHVDDSPGQQPPGLRMS